MSSIGWVDFSSAERERVAHVLSILKEQGTLDELGIGQVRDAFADQLFPGFSTIQIRAKYFVTLPRLFHDFHRLPTKQKRKTGALIRFLEEQENALARKLVERHGNDENGIIGKESIESGNGVARKPSSVYWNGLRKLELVKTPLSLNEFCKEFSALSSQPNDDELVAVKSAAALVVKDASVGEAWFEDCAIHLTRAEAELLRTQILHSRQITHSVPAQLFLNGLVEAALQLDADYREATHPVQWRLGALAQWVQLQPQVSEQCKRNLEMACQFSQAMEGAHIRYNYMIAQRANNDDEASRCAALFEQWLVEVKSLPWMQPQSCETWLSVAFDDVTRAKTTTRIFIRRWLESLQNNASTEELDELVKQQAKKNKGNRCLLIKTLPQDQGWVGMRQLEYRWPNVATILQDIVNGFSA